MDSVVLCHIVSFSYALPTNCTQLNCTDTGISEWLYQRGADGSVFSRRETGVKPRWREKIGRESMGGKSENGITRRKKKVELE